MSLKGLSAAKHAETSPAFLEAIKILTAAIEKLNDVTKKVYDNNAVFVVVTVTEHHAIRTKRQTPPAGEVVSVKLATVFQNNNLFGFQGSQQPLQPR